MRIISFSPAFSDDFKRLNRAWIEKYFEMEEEDERVLNDPQKFIIETGGMILLLEEGNRIIGTCALISQGEGSYQLAKMAVDEDFQGKGGGKLLLEAAIDEFKNLNGKKLFLYSNSRLAPAISLYTRFGFSFRELNNAVHRRSDTYMEYEG